MDVISSDDSPVPKGGISFFCCNWKIRSGPRLGDNGRDGAVRRTVAKARYAAAWVAGWLVRMSPNGINPLSG